MPDRTAKSQRPKLAVLAGCGGADRAVDRSDDPATVLREVAAEVTVAVAAVADRSPVAAPLTLPLTLSICMERNQVGPDDLVAAMLLARGAVVGVSRLDPASEPYPLPVGDARAAALRIGAYLRDLLGRAGSGTGSGRRAVAAAAAAALRSA